MTLDCAEMVEKIQTTIQQEFKIMAEFKMLQSESIPGVYLIPSAESSFIWFGVIFVRRGPYKEGIFRFNISIPQDFPSTSQSPTIIFQSQVYHPSVCPFTGTLDITEAFPKWNSSDNHLWQVAKYVIWLFENPDQGKVNHKEALESFSKNREDFLVKIKECVDLSKEKLYEPAPTDDRHYIIFESWNSEVHEAVLAEIKQGEENSI